MEKVKEVIPPSQEELNMSQENFDDPVDLATWIRTHKLIRATQEDYKEIDRSSLLQNKGLIYRRANEFRPFEFRYLDKDGNIIDLNIDPTEITIPKIEEMKITENHQAQAVLERELENLGFHFVDNKVNSVAMAMDRIVYTKTEKAIIENQIAKKEGFDF